MTGPISPTDLPARLRAKLGWRNCENLARICDRPLAHLSPGTFVRNTLRGMTSGWTAQELDDRWREVLRRAAKR